MPSPPLFLPPTSTLPTRAANPRANYTPTTAAAVMHAPRSTAVPARLGRGAVRHASVGVGRPVRACTSCSTRPDKCQASLGCEAETETASVWRQREKKIHQSDNKVISDVMTVCSGCRQMQLVKFQGSSKSAEKLLLRHSQFIYSVLD